MYRTAFSRESDVLLPRIIEKMEAVIHSDMRSSRLLCKFLKNVIMDDKAKIDGASIGKIADHFGNMTGMRGSPGEEYSDPNWEGYNKGFRPNRTPLMPYTNELVCLLVDQEVLDLEAERMRRLEASTDPVAPNHEAEDEDVDDEDIEVQEMALLVKAVDCVWDPPNDENHP